MTSLRKYLPCDHEDQFHVDRFDAFLTFIEALNAPVPFDIYAAFTQAFNAYQRKQGRE